MDVPVILEIPITATIGTDFLTGEKIENVLLKSREKKFKDNRVKGVLLTINSPGGGVNASDQIYKLLKAYKKEYKVPIYAYIDGICASGGYYIACASDKIYSTDVSLIGSIGVLSWPPFFNVKDLMEKVGVEALTVIAGKGKDDMNPFRKWQEGESDHYRQLIDFFYATFVNVVTTSRPQIANDLLVNTYGAQVFPAPQALKDGFIDIVGASRSEVLKELALAAGIKESQNYQVISFQQKSFYEKLFETKSPLLTGKLIHALELPKTWNCHQGVPFSYLYQ